MRRACHAARGVHSRADAPTPGCLLGSWPYYSLAEQWTSMEADWRAALGDEYVARSFPGSALVAWRQGGFHARDLPGSSIRCVVLNTNALAQGAGAEQLAWLEEELRAARRNQRIVFLMGHIPPGP